MIVGVTGTNTDVGKTVATAALACTYAAQGARVAVLKPVQTGALADAPTITRLTGITAHTFAHFPEPLAPNLSARRAGMRQPTLEEIVKWIGSFDADVTLVEGAGGLLVRLAEGVTICDLGAPLVVVTSLGLGSLNAAELTVEAARRRGVEVLGLIGGSLPQNPDLATRLNVEELPKVTGTPLLGCLPAGAGRLSREEFARVAARIRRPGD